MAASDTFEWFISTAVQNPTPEVREYIRDLRTYLFSLRSEDERQRFVDEIIEDFHRRLQSSGLKPKN